MGEAAPTGSAARELEPRREGSEAEPRLLRGFVVAGRRERFRRVRSVSSVLTRPRGSSLWSLLSDSIVFLTGKRRSLRSGS